LSPRRPETVCRDLHQLALDVDISVRSVRLHAGTESDAESAKTAYEALYVSIHVPNVVVLPEASLFIKLDHIHASKSLTRAFGRYRPSNHLHAYAKARSVRTLYWSTCSSSDY
jgi:hypothetical protein